MDSATLAKSLGMGFATGISTVSAATLVTLPASYIMNRFIYHGSLMRLMLGGVTACFSIFGIIIIALMLLLGKWKPVHYFGLLPVFPVTENPVVPKGYLSFIFTIFYALIHPITMFYINDEDEKGFVNTIEPMLVPKDAPTTTLKLTINGEEKDVEVRKGAVCEEFTAATQAAGSIPNDKVWKSVMKMLETFAKSAMNVGVEPANAGATAGATAKNESANTDPKESANQD
jgi:hypothetical protein